MGDSKLTSAFLAIVTKLCLENTKITEEAGLALAQLYPLICEGASGEVPDTIDNDKVNGLHNAISRLQDEPSEVTQTVPWITSGEKHQIRRDLEIMMDYD